MILSQETLTPLVSLSGIQKNFVECPRCGYANEIWYHGDLLVWWNTGMPRHCGHYEGVYETGEIGRVQARFK